MVKAKKLSIPKVRTSALKQQDNFAHAAGSLEHLQSQDLSKANLNELATVVQQAHDAFQSHMVSALQAALVAGNALVLAKEKFLYDRKVGGFRGWVIELGISRATSYRYMDLAQNRNIVSQAETLSDALELLARHKAEQRALQATEESPSMKKRRATLTLSSERDQKLEMIAESKGVEVSLLISEVLDRWLSRQKNPEQIDIF